MIDLITKRIGSAALIAAAAALIFVGAALIMPADVYADAEPVQIGTYEELSSFISGINDGTIPLDQDVVLTANIGVPEIIGNAWEPLAKDNDHAYQGVFDGAGHKIYGISVDRSNSYPKKWKGGEEVHNFTAFCSFLGENGTIKELNLVADFIDVNDVGGIVSQNQGEIIGCKFKGLIQSEVYPNAYKVESFMYPTRRIQPDGGEVGGIAAASKGKITSCETRKGSMIGIGGESAGGIVGRQIDGGEVYDCVNRGRVIISGKSKYPMDYYVNGGAGGIAGSQFISDLDNVKKPVIESCVNWGTVRAMQGAAGIVAQSDSGDVLGCMNFGTVDGVTVDWCAGICGYFTVKDVVPQDETAELSGCMNYGSVNPSALDRNSGMFMGMNIGGVVAHVVDGGGGTSHDTHVAVWVHDNLNYGDVYGNQCVGGVIGHLENALLKGETLAYSNVNLGSVTGNTTVGGVVGACPGVAADMANYGSVNLCPLDEEDEYYFGGGVAGEMSTTGGMTTSYSVGDVSIVDINGNLIEDDQAYIGGVVGGAMSPKQFDGCYYSADSAVKVLCPNGAQPDYKTGALTLKQMGGQEALTNMPELFDGTTSTHKSKVWKTVDNIEKENVTYYMTPQQDGLLVFDLSEILDAGAVVSYPIDVTNAKVLIATQKYTGQELKPVVELSIGGIDADPTSYDIDAPGPYVEPGSYPVKVKMKDGGDYTGEATGVFKIINPKDISKADVTIPSNYYHNGYYVAPEPVVKLDGQVVDPSNYDFKVQDLPAKMMPGTYTVNITAKGDDYEGVAVGKYKILKLPQKIKSVTPLTKTVKRGKSFQLKTVVDPAGIGKVSYKKTKGNKKITVSKAGTVKVNKKLKKGTYKIKVKVTVSETDIYASASKTKTIKIKVK